MAQGPKPPVPPGPVILQAPERPEPVILQAPERPEPEILEAPEPRNLFLIGHGFTTSGFLPGLYVEEEQDEREAAYAKARAKSGMNVPSGYHQEDPRQARIAALKCAPKPQNGWYLRVPENMWVAFYQEEFLEFDSKWEVPIRNGKWTDPVIWVRSGDQNVSEHILAFPSLHTSFALNEMANIYKPGFDLDNDVHGGSADAVQLEISRDLVSGDALYVGHQVTQRGAVHNLRGACRGNYAFLSDILAAISRKVPANPADMPVFVHWFACRSPWEGSARFYAQVASPFDAKGGYGELSVAEMRRVA